jgi:anti-sigma regulatory factor (Ser/Thr protein kinase)
MLFSQEDHPQDERGEVPADLHYATIPAEAEKVAGFRRVLTSWASGVGMAAERVQALTLATYEAMANVVKHAYRGLPGTLELHATYLAELHQVTVTVIDKGHWRPLLAEGGPARSGGRGLPLIRALAEDTDITTSTRGTSVRMRWRT